MKKVLKLFCWFFCLLFFSTSFVDAEYFLINPSTCANISGCNPIPGNDSNTKYIADGNGKKGSLAYCSDHDKYFYGRTTNGVVISDNIPYKKDKNYAKAKECTYTTDEKVDCSEIIGYIIAHAQKYYGQEKGYNIDNAWYWTQATVWAYMAEFTPWSSTNTNAANFYEQYGSIRGVIKRAWNDYKDKKVYQTIDDDDVDFRINSGNDFNFYYYPSTTTCGTGYYKTKDIILKNKENNSIDLEITTNNNNVKICKKGEIDNCSDVLNFSVNKNESIEFYLKSTNDRSFDVNLEISASYEEKNGTEINVEHYDSVRWILTSPRSNAQGMLTFVKKNKKVSTTVHHEKTVSKTFNKVAIVRTGCPAGSNSNNGSSTKPISKVCANEANSVDDYSAKFSGCTCMGLNLGNGRYVNIILKESVGFNFGELTPYEDIYAGGGFSLSELGVKTKYKAIIKWEYADKKNGKPYYYNENNLALWDATNLEHEINEALLNKMKRDGVQLQFNTLNSNKYDINSDNNYTFSLNLPLSNFSFSNKVATLEIDTIKLQQAYFSSDGNVKYGESDDTYMLDGGFKYYVPMGYAENSTVPVDFDFDISKSNLSIVDGIDFWYQAECNPKVQERYYHSLSYRSIDVNNPFPKSGNLTANVPENWREWYCGNGTTCSENVNNQNRIKNTYRDDYPNNPLYKIVLDDKKVAIIRGIEDYYTNWNGINADGSSDFINPVVDKPQLFDSKATSSSYCPLGIFRENCD